MLYSLTTCFCFSFQANKNVLAEYEQSHYYGLHSFVYLSYNIGSGFAYNKH